MTPTEHAECESDITELRMLLTTLRIKLSMYTRPSQSQQSIEGYAMMVARRNEILMIYHECFNLLNTCKSLSVGGIHS